VDDCHHAPASQRQSAAQPRPHAPDGCGGVGRARRDACGHRSRDRTKRCSRPPPARR
jgi:hypothetical protein